MTTQKPTKSTLKEWIIFLGAYAIGILTGFIIGNASK